MELDCSKKIEKIFNLNFEEFVIFIKQEISSSDDVNYEYVTKSILEILKSFNNNDDLKTISIIQDSNITSNSVFKMKINDSENKKCILKIRRESSSMKFSDELNYLNKLQLRELIPKQLMNIESGHLKISIEEFINIKHIKDHEAYEQNHMSKIINSIAEFSSIETKIIDIKEIFNYPFFYFNYLVNKLLPTSISRLRKIQSFFDNSKIKDSISFSYYQENKNVLVKINKFLNEIPNYVSKIISNFSFDNKIPLVFTHIDVHTWNFFIETETEKIKFIDFEDLSFCILGFDLANYIIESEYSINEDCYPFYTNNLNSFTEDFVKNSMQKYIHKLNLSTGQNFPILSLDDIYRLFCLSIIKAVSEYVFMVDEEIIYLKQDIDFLLLMADRISVFEKYYLLIN
jgi:thiamine kinase-like enzyme